MIEREEIYSRSEMVRKAFTFLTRVSRGVVFKGCKTVVEMSRVLTLSRLSSGAGTVLFA
jgi:hypothetical protein